MNGERRLRLTERYMDPPGQAMPDCLIAARIANHMERVFREMGKHDVADKFKGFDWKTEEDAFMDGYHANAKGGEFVTYERLSAMGTNGVQEPATGFEGGKLVGTKRLFADGKFNSKDGKATFMATQWRGLQAARQAGGIQKIRLPDQQWSRQPCLAKRLSRSGERFRHGSLALSLYSDAPRRYEGALAQSRRSGRGV